MSVSLWIPSALQFGELAPGEARQGAMRQALAQTIKSHLFGEAAGGETGSSYDRILIAFAQALSEGFAAPDSRPAAQTLWASLFPAEQLSAAAAATDANQVPAAVESAFCFCVHGLCAAVALHRVESLEPTAVDPVEEDDEEEETGENDGPGAADWRADYPQAVGLVAGLLRQAAWRWLRDDCADETAKAEGLRLVAAVLLDTLLGALGDWFAVETGETRIRNGRPHTSKSIGVRQPALAQRLGGLLAALPFRFTVQPLRQPVAYRPNHRGPADDQEMDCFRVDLIGYRRTNDFLRHFHAGAASPHHRAPDFLRYVEAVNIQQAVPWRINRRLLHWACALIQIGGGRARFDPNASPDLAALDPEALKALREWVRENFYRPAGTGPRKTIERPGEFLDSPLAYRVLDELCRNGSDGQPVAFYLAWKADYRGRLYAETPWLTPQGGDLQRALLEFHGGRPLDADGGRALRRHGANLVRRARLLADLKLEGRQVVTLDERERWALEHEADILASAEAPLATPFWREVAGKPMQFLAFCLAYRQWKSNPALPIHLPVQIDGTCNGLQHIAALTGDAALAPAVNVLPRADGLPGDIYSELATAAAGALGRLNPNKDKKIHREGLEFADAWLAASPQRRTWLNRDSAKKVVMTIPYGASRGAQAGHVLETIAQAFERAWQEGRPALREIDALVDWKNQNKARRLFVARCTRGLFDPPRQTTFASADEPLVGELAHAEWERQRTLAAYVALAVAEHLHAALVARYPVVKALSDWLKTVAETCSELPLLWQSPLGFPVCQDKFKLGGTSATARIGAKAVRIDVQRLDEVVDKRKQRDALLPNLIHSLDATHLALTLLDARARGVTDLGSIHDCLLCHPNDAAELGWVVRDTFARLYRPGRLDLPAPLIRWRDWMALLAELKAVPRRSEALAALIHPGEQAERDLDHDARRGEQNAVKTLDVLAAIRRRDPSERFLVHLVLEHAVSLPPAKVAPPMPYPPCAAALPLADDALSDYFFS